MTSKRIYRVYWDNGASACGVFPRMFDSFEAADAYGLEWTNESNLREFGTLKPITDAYTYAVLEEELKEEKP